MELAGGADVLQSRRQHVELSYAPLRNSLPEFDCMILEWLVRWHPLDRHYLVDTPLPYPFMPTTPAWADNSHAELLQRQTVTNQQVQHVATRLWSHSRSEVVRLLHVYDRYPHFLDV